MRLINRARRRLANWIRPREHFVIPFMTPEAFTDMSKERRSAIKEVLEDVKPVVFPHYTTDDDA